MFWRVIADKPMAMVVCGRVCHFALRHFAPLHGVGGHPALARKVTDRQKTVRGLPAWACVLVSNPYCHIHEQIDDKVPTNEHP